MSRREYLVSKSEEGINVRRLVKNKSWDITREINFTRAALSPYMLVYLPRS